MVVYIFHRPDPVASDKFFSLVYIKPWCRMGPYIIGLLYGYFIFMNKNKSKLNTVKRSFISNIKRHFYKILNLKDLNIFLHVFSIFALNLMVFGVYPNTTQQPLSRVANILYQATSRYRFKFK